MQQPRQILWLGVMALGLIGGAMPPASQANEIPCAVEIQTYCGVVQPGGGRIMQCLKANGGKLSMACAARLHDLQEALSGPLGTCQDDWVAYCYLPRALPPRADMIRCLENHHGQLSSGCQKALQGASGRQDQRSRGMMP